MIDEAGFAEAAFEYFRNDGGDKKINKKALRAAITAYLDHIAAQTPDELVERVRRVLYETGYANPSDAIIMKIMAAMPPQITEGERGF